MSLAGRFAAALAAEPGGSGELELLPDRLARAAARVLAVDGVGFSVRAGARGRTPLGTSSPEAGRAERLQFTAGDGPCAAVYDSGQPVFAVAEDLRRRWPAYAELLLTGTPFRGVVCLPLRSTLTGVGVLDVFLTEPQDVPRLDVFDALAVGALITSALGDAALWSSWTAADGPGWLRTPAAARRAAVWEAVGRTSTAWDVDAPSALALLRAHTWATGRSLDSVAADLLAGRLTPGDVAGRDGG
ncbi:MULTISPECIES: GAF domain-containing protein [unclassified Modestobacter]